MGRYQFPVKWHRFKKEEFDRKKAEYNAKYGYTVHFPGLSDVFHLGLDNPPTEAELAKYRSDRPGELSVRRWEEIKQYKWKKKQSFLRMMSSPTPTWAQNIGTAMTFLDDMNDALGTAAVIARFAMYMFPKALGKVLYGPAGWALLAADICNIAMTLSRLPLKVVNLKANLHKGLGLNPFSKKAAVARAKKLSRHRLSAGEAIELLQVTDNAMGAGLCLGPIVGMLQDVAFGMYRIATGKRVDISSPLIELALHEAKAHKAMKAAQQLSTGGQELSDEDHCKAIITANACTQILYPINQLWHPLDALSDVSAVELRAPWPTDPSTLELFREERINPYEHLGFLHLDKQYANPFEIWDASVDKINHSITGLWTRQKHTYLGLVASQSSVELVQNSYSLIEDEDSVVLDYSTAEKLFHKMFDNGWRLAEQDDPNALACMAQTIEKWGDRYLAYKWEQLQSWLTRDCNVKFTREIPQ